jgi:predicted ATP-grasp superfamily ATP-dependent carboligase
VSAFGLVGWFGVDFILKDGIPWPVEVNPRYTAAVEVYELALGRSLLNDHRRACGAAGDSLPSSQPGRNPHGPRIIGKLILYAPRTLTVPEIALDDSGSRDGFAVPAIADIPWPGTCFEAGEPVMTLYASGPDVPTCLEQLQQHRSLWMRKLGIVDGEVTMSGFPLP